MPIDVPNPNLVRANLNYAENLLLSHPNARSKTHLALVGVIEPSTNDLKSGFTRNLTFDQLYHEVSKLIELFELNIDQFHR